MQVKEETQSTETKTFDKDKLKECTTAEEIENYFDSIGVASDDYTTKLSYIFETMNASKNIKIDKEVTAEDYQRHLHFYLNVHRKLFLKVPDVLKKLAEAQQAKKEETN